MRGREKKCTMLDRLMFNPSLIAAIAALAVSFFLAWFLFDIHRKWRRMFGTRSTSSADILAEVLQRLMRIETKLTTLEPRLSAIEAIGEVAVQKIGFLRFNPFEHTGGDQSFALALLDRANSGVIISSLYTREGVRVYAKEVRNGASKHSLSEEEQRVLEQALRG